MEVVYLDTHRDTYGAKQIIGQTYTVGDLINELGKYSSDTPIMVRNDSGYTYGIIDYDTLTEEEVDE